MIIDDDLEEEVIAVASVSVLLGKTPKTFRSWIQKGVMPPPILEGIDRPEHKFYSLDEVKVISNTLKRNAETMRFLVAGSRVVTELYNAVDKVRSKKHGSK